MAILNKRYYKNFTTIELAKKLLGKYLVSETQFGRIVGMITETEAYVSNDEASHAFKGLNTRNKSMFEIPGTIYIYLIYGVYYCLNIVGNLGEAVLIRAIEPLEGIGLIKSNLSLDSSKKVNLTKLTNGPGKICKALNIDKSIDGFKSWKAPIYILNNKSISDENIIITKRVGINKAVDMELRFYIKDSLYISKK